MARMSVDDSVGRDPRITGLARIVGLERNAVVGILVCSVWPICYDQLTHLVAKSMIDDAAGVVGWADAMLETGLARRDRSGLLSVTGARERIEYLTAKRDAGRQGGLKSAELRANMVKQTSSTPVSTPQARRNPPVPDPAPAPAPAPAPKISEEDSDTLSVVGPQPVSGPRRRAKPKSDPTPTELASVAAVLE